MKKFSKLITLMMVFVLLLTSLGGCASGVASQDDQTGDNAQNPSAVQSEFPNKEITLICPWAAGASADLQCRALAQAASKHLGVEVIVVNQEGAGGILATTQLKTTAADGYTIALGVIGLFTAQPLLNPDLGYSQDDFDFLMTTASAPCAILVSADSPYYTIEDMMEDAKQNGKTITFGSPGANSTPHLAGETFFKETGIPGEHIPFNGGSATLTALLGNQIDAASLVISDAVSQIQAGTLRCLGIASEERIAVLPDVPTMAEQGYDYTFKPTWYLFAPAGLPEDVKTVLADAFSKAVEDPDFIATMDGLNINVTYLDAEATLQSFEDQKKLIQAIIDEG